MYILERSCEIIKKQWLIPIIFILFAYFLGIMPLVYSKTIDQIPQLSQIITPNNLPNIPLSQPTTSIENAKANNSEENNKLTTEVLKTILTIAITLYISILIAIITLYQNLYKNIDDKISKLKEDLKTEVFLKVKDEFSNVLDKINKQSDDFNSITKSYEAKFSEFSNEINRLTGKHELRNKSDDLIQNIKNEYAIFYAKQANSIGLTLELAKLEKILRSIKSEDNNEVTINLKTLISMLLNPEKLFEQAVLDYLRLLAYHLSRDIQ